jgi:hypothetical protein
MVMCVWRLREKGYLSLVQGQPGQHRRPSLKQQFKKKTKTPKDLL